MLFLLTAVPFAIKEFMNSDAVVYATQNGLCGDLFYMAGFAKEEKTGIYHARQDAIQQYFGYAILYDVAFDCFTDMKAKRYTFSTADGETYALWAWKGDYWNLGAGAELGIYRRWYNTGIWEVDRELALPMTLDLKDTRGNTILSYNPSEKQWWITGFNPYRQNVKANELVATYTIDFSSRTDMYWALYRKYRSQDKTIQFNSKKYIVTITL